MKTAVYLALIANVSAAGDESFITCRSNKDCPNDAKTQGGMFNGTCCGRSDFVKGDPYKLGGDWAKVADLQATDPKVGNCNAAATLNFGKIPTGGMKGNEINIGEYLKFNWDTEDWARPYFVSTMGKVPLDKAPKDFEEWRKMIEKDYTPAQFWFESAFVTNCFEPRMAPEKKKSDMDWKMCKSNDDCGKGFEDGCCIRSEITFGHDAFAKQPQDVKFGFEKLQKEPEMGFCAPKEIKDFTEDKEVNMYDYEKFLFTIPKMKEYFFKDWPKDAARPDNFEDWAKAVEKDYPGIKDWKNFGF